MTSTIINSPGSNMNFEIAGLWLNRVHNVFESAKQQFPHECTVEISSFEANDGGPYGSLNNATHYRLDVNVPEGTDERFTQGIINVLAEVTGA